VATKRTAEKKAPARKPATRRSKRVTEITQEQIAERAYFLHLERGGDPFENWLNAEQELVTT
jgi:hypothetical protein